MSGLDDLRRIGWQTWRVGLRNERNLYQKEHPWFIFQAVLNHAAGRAGVDKTQLFYHPLTRLERRVHKGKVYALEFVFPHDNGDVPRRFADGLATHLKDPDNNFSLIDCSEITPRCYDALAAETGPLPEDEICLDFLTPCPFKPLDPARNWLIDGYQFIRLLVNRINRFYSPGLGTDAFLAGGVRTLPYYWEFCRHSHKTKSGPGEQVISGMTGPLYLRGDLRPLLPLLQVCQELHCGAERGNGQGYYRLSARQTYFDGKLASFAAFQEAFAAVERSSDIASEIATAVLDQPEYLRQLHETVMRGEVSGRAAEGHYEAKRRGEGQRLVATLAPDDFVIHKCLHRLLSETFDRMFEESSVGFRPDCSREDAARAIRQARDEGFCHVLESDIAAFFDEIDWGVLAAQLDAHLPLADCLTRQLLTQVITTPFHIHGHPCERSRGLLQGSPLSPLLANLYLDPFDEEMQEQGFRLIRYADDFVVMTRSADEAQLALRAIEKSLARLKLRLKSEKTRIGAVDLGFSFLGLSFAPGLDEEFVGSARDKTLFITDRYVFAGIDHHSIVIRKAGKLLARFPLRQVAEIILLGDNALSTRLLHRCSRENIPVSFCSPTGQYFSTLKPDSKGHFSTAGQHWQRFAALSDPDRLAVARRLVIAKVHNYLEWFKESWGEPLRQQQGQVKDSLETLVANVSKADTIDTVRGYEGVAAKITFRFVNDRLIETFFKSSGRRKRERLDPWNSLLDFSYSLLFTRINVLLRSRGLNPFLGFLHSDKDNFESLACDLQEPFRCRMDRFAARAVNLKVIREESFERDEYGRYRLTAPAVGVFLDYFEREMNTRLGRDHGTLRQLLVAQAQSLSAWAQGADSLRIYESDR